MGFAMLLLGPAGSGKSTLARAIKDHRALEGKNTILTNMDPAVEFIPYEPDIDIRNRWKLKTVMKDKKLGPNGGLLRIFEMLLKDDEWFMDELSTLACDSLVVFDFPGQVELAIEPGLLDDLVMRLEQKDFRLCGVSCFDSTFGLDPSKSMAGRLVALTTVIALRIPHVVALTKTDLLLPDCATEENQAAVYELAQQSAEDVMGEFNAGFPTRYRALNEAFASVIDDFALTSFQPVNLQEEGSMAALLMTVDFSLQEEEAREPRCRDVD